jgi:hypothetical protein
MIMTLVSLKIVSVSAAVDITVLELDIDGLSAISGRRAFTDNRNDLARPLLTGGK